MKTRNALFLSSIFLLLATFAFAQTFLNLVKSGTAAQIEAALRAGATIDQRDANGETALMYAAVFNRDPEVVSVLIAAGAEVEDRDNDGYTALMWAARNSDNPAIVSALVKAGAAVEGRNKNDATALMLAAGNNVNPAVMSALLDAGAKVQTEDANGGTPLLYAVETNQNPDIVSTLLKAGVPVQARDRSGLSVLMHAASFSQNPGVISVLINAGAKIDERDGSSNTALIYAAARNMNPALVSALVTAGADIDARNNEGMTPIMMAGRYNGNPEVISALIRQGAKITDRDREGETTLHHAAANNRNPQMISALVRAGSIVDEPDVYGRTALAVAASYTKNPEVIEALLAAGADAKKKDNQGKTAFDRAGENPSLDGTKARWDLDVTRALAKGLLIVQYRFYDIFPVFYGYYDTHPLGQVVIINTLDKPVSGVTMSFFVREFMDAPRQGSVPVTLLPNEPATVDLFAVFQPRILQVTENMKVVAEVTLEYIDNGQPQKKVIQRTLPILKRNALNWDDTRKAGAFVSPSDPTVLRFAKNVSSAVSGRTNPALDPNLTLAIAMHDALRLFGLAYSLDPIPVLTPNRNVADFIQFPRQTLDNRSGKCSDLSVLYSSLLEAVGVETAFITTPGHIFIAVALGMNEEDARRFFGTPDDLIFQEGKVWLPLEVTLREGDFLTAWGRGAQEWREDKAKDQAALYPLHEAWKSFEPVALPGPEPVVSPPTARDIAALVQDDIAGFVTKETSERVAALQEQIAKDNGAPRPVNDLGVLYARYGMWDRAEAQFTTALLKREYVPALVNLGNIAFVKGDIRKALKFYERANKENPASAAALLGLARSYGASGDFSSARQAYRALKSVDPDQANRLAYLDKPVDPSTRASDADRIQGLLWEQE